MNIDWNDSFRVGDAVIDREHQALFAIANAVHLARDQAALRLSAMQLYQYVREHFAHEENLMKEIRFPDSREHIDSHIALVTRLNDLSVGIGKNQTDLQIVVRFMNDWALHHIPSEDAKLAHYVNSRRASDS